MSSLVKHYENRKREHQLEGFNQCCIHVILCLFCFCLTCPDVLRCNPARLGIRLQIVLVCGFLYERSLPHRVCYHIAHLQEADTVFQKGTIDDFVSRIDNARHVSAFMQGFIRQSEITETTGVRLLESERAYLNKSRRSNELCKRKGIGKAYCMGTRMSGIPNCALTARRQTARHCAR